jgi:hypothetical protein
MAIWRGRQMRGAKHPNWKGGISNRPYAVRKVIETKKKEVGRCEVCGATESLQGHHIGEKIRVLCVHCHADQHPKLKGFIMASKKQWIAGAIKHKGALHKQLGVPEGKKIPAGKLNKAAKAGGKLGQRARLAETLKKMH